MEFHAGIYNYVLLVLLYDCCQELKNKRGESWALHKKLITETFILPKKYKAAGMLLMKYSELHS